MYRETSYVTGAKHLKEQQALVRDERQEVTSQLSSDLHIRVVAWALRHTSSTRISHAIHNNNSNNNKYNEEIKEKEGLKLGQYKLYLLTQSNILKFFIFLSFIPDMIFGDMF